MGAAEMSVDVDEIRTVASFCGDTASAVGAAAEGLAAHQLGMWAVGDEYRELGRRYAAMGRKLADRLAEQAQAAGKLGDALHRAATAVADTEAAAARDIFRATDHPGENRTS